MINREPITAKNTAMKMTEQKIITNSIREDKITSFLEKPKILKTKF